MTGRELYEQWCALAGTKPEWPEISTPSVDRTMFAWNRLAELMEERTQERIALVIAHREGKRLSEPEQ